MSRHEVECSVCGSPMDTESEGVAYGADGSWCHPWPSVCYRTAHGLPGGHTVDPVGDAVFRRDHEHGPLPVAPTWEPWYRRLSAAFVRACRTVSESRHG